GVTSFAVLPGAVGFWVERLLRHGIKYDGPKKRFDGAQVISFKDHDGLLLEIVAHERAEARSAWGNAPGIPLEHAIHGFDSVTLWEQLGTDTERVLTDVLGFRAVTEESGTRRFAAGDAGAGTIVDVRTIGGFVAAQTGAGTVHHVAFRAATDAAQLE